MQSQLRYARYDDDDRLYVENTADRAGDAQDDNAAIRELQAGSRAVILRACQNAANTVVNHRDYPAASDPIPQFVLYRPVSTLRSVVLGADETFNADLFA